MPGCDRLVADQGDPAARDRHELVTETEPRSQSREQGITGIADAREVHMEPDGAFSVVARGESAAA